MIQRCNITPNVMKTIECYVSAIMLLLRKNEVPIFFFKERYLEALELFLATLNRNKYTPLNGLHIIRADTCELRRCLHVACNTIC